MNAKGKNDVSGRGRRRDESQRTPRPGGRAAAQRATGAGKEQRAYPTRGSAALQPEPVPAATPVKSPWLKVAPPLPVAVPRLPFIMLVLFVVVGGVLGILLVNTKINENAFRLDRLHQQEAALNLQQQDLEQQIAAYESPGNLAAAARKLGLVPAGSPAFIRLPDGKVIGVPQPAGGAPSVATNPLPNRQQPPAGR